MTDAMWRAVRALQGRSDISLGADLREIVRAVLLAVREPDEAMTRQFLGLGAHARAMWPLMINAILEKQK